MSEHAAIGEPTTASRPRRARIGIVAGMALVVIGAVVLMALLGSLIAPHDPAAQDPALGVTGPGGGHPLGTDDLGRDVLSRLIVGARTALVGPAIAALLATTVGTALGLLAGYRGGLVDGSIMRGVDLLYALPALLVAIIVVGVLGSGYALAVLVIAVVTCPNDVRLVRSAVLAQRELPYVEAARTLGLRPWRVMVVHLLPNVLPTVVASLLLNFVVALVGLSALSFLGLGVTAGTADWGLMLAENRRLVDVNPWSAVAPALLIVLLAAAVTIAGDRIFDLLSERGRNR